MITLINDKYLPAITAIVLLIAITFMTVCYTLSDGTATTKKSDLEEKVFDTNGVTRIDISVEDDQWKNLLENATDEEYIPCNVTVNGKAYDVVGIRAKGNSSLTQVANDDNTDRYSFCLNFSKYNDQSLFGLDKLALNNIISDPTYMKEYLSYEMFHDMGVTTPLYSYANIKVNGKEWGLYLAVEILGDEFLQRNYGTDYGNLYKPESMEMNGKKGEEGFPKRPDDGKERKNGGPMGQGGPDGSPMNQGGPGGQGGPMGQGVPMGQGRQGTSLVYSDDKLDSYAGIFDNTITKHTKKADKERLLEILKNLNSGEKLESNVDVQAVLRYFAVNTFLVNLDSYAGGMKHNYYLYEKDSKIQILPWDFNLSFGAFQMNDASKVINFPIDKPVTDSMENSPLISKLLENDTYKEQYHKYYKELLNQYISNGKYEKEIERINQLIADYVKNDTTAFYSYDEYTVAIEELKVYFEERSNSITQQLNGSQPSETYGTLGTKLNMQALGGMGGDKKQGQMGPNKINDNLKIKEEGKGHKANAPAMNNSSNQRELANFKWLYLLLIVPLVIGISFVWKFSRKKYHS